MPTLSWQCPFCGHHATVGDNHTSVDSHQFDLYSKYGAQHLVTRVISCANPSCKEITISASLHDYKAVSGGQLARHQARLNWQLVPAARMRPLPDYVPEPIRLDYQEACLIRGLSPKASATLSRRCLQGMIRDFWGITRPRLIDEIRELKDKVDPMTWDAIDGIRSIGNIGAHMEADINVIIDVDTDEAEALIQLVESLIDDWYVERDNRRVRREAVLAVANAKRAAKPAKK